MCYQSLISLAIINDQCGISLPRLTAEQPRIAKMPFSQQQRTQNEPGNLILSPAKQINQLLSNIGETRENSHFEPFRRNVRRMNDLGPDWNALLQTAHLLALSICLDRKDSVASGRMHGLHRVNLLPGRAPHRRANLAG
jgi:hypothetical protein